MNKKTIIALTSISLSALAVGALSFARFNQNSFAKADAADKTITLDKNTIMNYEDMGGGEYLAIEDVSTGLETYLHTEITIETCSIVEDANSFLHVTTTVDDWGSLYIDFDVLGLTSFTINGSCEHMDYYGTDYWHTFYDSYWNKPSDGKTKIEGLEDFELNEKCLVNTSGKQTEHIEFIFNGFTSLTIESIEFTVSCLTTN